MKTLKLLATLFISASTIVGCKCLKSKEKMTDLENTNWSLVKTADKNYTANDENPNGIYISFADGNFSTSDGCNSLGGEYKIDGNAIELDKIRATMRYCDKEYMDKHGYPVAFYLIKKFEVKGNKLYLYQEDGKTIAAEYENK